MTPDKKLVICILTRDELDLIREQGEGACPTMKTIFQKLLSGIAPQSCEPVAVPPEGPPDWMN